MNRISASTAAFAAAFLLVGFGARAAESTCVKCHTDDATMQRLFVAPPLAASEGEG